MKVFMENNLDMPLSKVLEIIQNRVMEESKYFGIKTLKTPFDFWIYQEIVFELKPDVIIEIGNYRGGSTLALAHLCDQINKGRIIGIDISHVEISDMVKKHPRITFFTGDANSVFDVVKESILHDESVLIIDDSSHTFENTLGVLRIYSTLVKPGGYFIVEDSICHHGLSIGPKPGPYEAVEAFISENKKFEIDRSRESFLLTWNPKGYLVCKS